MALVTRLSVRTGAPSEVWVSVRVPGRPIARIPVQDHPQEEGWRAAGLVWTVVEPGRTLHARYEGPLVSEDGEVDAVLDLTFEDDGPLIDFSDGVDPAVTARAIAAQPWSRRFFEGSGDPHRPLRAGGPGPRHRAARQRDPRWTCAACATTASGASGTPGASTSGSRDPRGRVGFTAACIRYDFIGPLTAGFFIDGVHAPSRR